MMHPQYRPTLKRALAVPTAFAALLGSLTMARATSDLWTGSTSGAWLNSANWSTSPATVPGTGDTATFNAFSANTTIDLGGGVTISNILFDTSAAAYTLGSGAVGSQTLTLGQANGGVTVSSSVANNQTVNANLALASIGTYTFLNDSARTMTLAGTNTATSTGISVFKVDGAGNTTVSGPMVAGTGTLNLEKTGSGTLTLSGGATWSGNGVNEYLAGSTLVPAVLRAGTTIITGGLYTNNGEFTIGGVIANGGDGNNVNLTMNGGVLALTSGNWFSLGRGNGIGGVSTDVVLNNSASIVAPNVSLGYNANSANLPKGSLTLNNNSAFNVNGNFYIGESAGSQMTLTVNDSAGVTNANSAGVRVSSSGTGTLRLNGGNVRTEGDFVIAYSTALPDSAGVVVNGGNLFVATTTKRWLQVGRSGSGSAQLAVSKGAVNLNANTDIRFSTQNTSTATNTVSLEGGSITFYSDNATTVGGSGVVDLMQVGTATSVNTFNLDGGTLTVGQVLSAANTGTRFFNFNGGTLKAAVDAVTLMNLGAGNAFANVRNGGAVIDSNGKNVTLAQALLHSAIPGDAATDGGLTKNGAGTLALAAGNTYTGPTRVSAGTLVLAGTNLISQSLSVSDGATLLVPASPATRWAPTTMTVGSAAGATLSFMLGGTTQAPLNPGTLTLIGANLINIAGGNFVAGTSYPLITYTTLAGSGSYSLAPLPSGVTGNLSVSGNTIYFNVTGVSNTAWTGAVNGTWDIATTANWTNAAGGNTYTDGSLVQFDDTGLTTIITNSVATVLKPASVLVNNTTKNYTFQTNTIIAGTTSLSKTGTGSLTNSTPNTYTGPTVINQGAVVAGVASVANVSGAVGNNSAVTLGNDASAVLNLNGFPTQIGSLSGGGPNAGNVVLGSATLTVGGDNASPSVYAGNISGTGGLTKIGSGTLTLGGTNTYTGATAISGGTLTYTSGAVQTNAATFTIGTAGGFGTMNVNSGSSVTFGSTTCTIGYRTGVGVLNVNGGTFSGGNDLRVGGSDANGTTYNGYGTLNVTAGTATVNSLTIARGNNNQNAISGEVDISGGTLSSAGDIIVGYAGTGIGRINLNGGTFNVATTATKWLRFGEWDSTSAEMNINSGNFNLNMGSSIKFNSQNSSGRHTINQNGGAVTFYSDFATKIGGGGNLDLQNNGNASTAATNTYNLNGGTLTVPQVASSASGATRVFNFNGGTLKPTASSTTFFNLGSGNAFANVRNGGAIIDTSTNSITIAQPLAHSTIDGDNGFDGGLTKLGNGTLTFSGALAYTGPTRVLGGTLSLDSSKGLPSGGDLQMSSATLTLNASSGSAMYVNNASLGTNLNLALSQYAGALVVFGNLTLSDNTVINLNYGTLAANPTVAAISASGALTRGNNITVNVSGIGFGVGVVPLITVPGLSSTSGFVLGSLPTGVKAVLTNSVTGELDLLITGAGQLLSWHGASADNSVLLSTWDINNSSNWYDLTMNPAKYLQYAGNTYGDNVIFDDKGYNLTGTNVVTLNTTVVPATVLFSSSTYPFLLTGSGGIGGTTALQLTNDTQVIFLATSNSYTGGTLLGSGTLAINNDNALGAAAGGVTFSGGTLQVNGSTTNNVRPFTAAADSSFGVANGVVGRFGGAFSGPAGLTKTDAGTLILAGTNDIAGSLQVAQGTLTTLGTNALPAVVRVGNTASSDGVLTIPAGIFGANNDGGQYGSSLLAGSAGGSFGEITLNGGTLNVAQQLALGAGQGGYGALSMSGGVLNCGSYIVVGFNNDHSVYNQSGGTTTLSSNLMTIAAGGTGSIGVANFTGGTFISSFPTSSGIMVGERGTGTMNVSGSATIITTNSNGLVVGPAASQTGWNGTLNLNGGTVMVNKISKGLGTGWAAVNFNGANLLAAGNNAAFLNGMDLATVYAGGLTVDDGGFAVTIPQALVQPTGAGVSSISISTDSSGYIDSPLVTISGGTGSNATAMASVSGGKITGIVVTSPGTGYGLSDTLSVSFIGGGANAVPPTTTTVHLAANSSGGLTKNGAGTLTLSGVNTYAGTTVVNNGELFLTPACQSGAPVQVADGARFGINATALSNSTTIGALTLGTTAGGSTILDFSFGFGGNPTLAALRAGAVTLNGTSTVRISGSFGVGTFPLLQYTSLSGNFAATVLAPRGVSASLSNDPVNKVLSVVINSVASGIVWTGTDSVSPNLWDLNTTPNWLLGSTPTTYQETLPPGDVVLFNDVGSGLVLLSNTASPASVTISNNSVNYTFQGTGRINSSVGLTKLGSGTATLNVPGTYSGNTVIADGTLSLGTNQTFANLTGSGTIATASGSPMLTVNDSANTTFTGIMQGGLGLTKTGNGTLTLTATNNFSGNVFAKRGTLLLDSGAINGGTAYSSIGQSDSDNATLILKGTGTFTNNGDFNLGDIGSSTGTLYLSNNAALMVGAMYVGSANVAGSTASGTVNQTGGTVQNTYLNIGGRTSTNGVGVYNLSGGTLTGTGTVRAGGVGTGTLNISGTASASFAGTGAHYVGYRTGIGALNVTGGSFSAAGELQVGGSDANGAQYNATGAVTVANATMTLGALTIARGNYLDNSCGGSVTLNSGSTLISTNDVIVEFAGTGLGKLALNGGTLILGPAATKWLMVGWYDTGAAELDITNGSLLLENGSSIKMSRSGNTGGNVINQLGGNVAFYSDAGVTVGGTGNLDLDLGGSASTVSTYNLNGGTLTVPQIIASSTTGSSLFNFNGGTLQAAASSTTFMRGLTAANVRTGGAIIDTTNNNITIAQALLNNGMDEDGGLTKTGNGALLLNGVNTYTNVTRVLAGTLGGTGTIAGAVTVNSGAGLAPGAGIGTLAINGNLTLAPGSTNTFEVNGTTPTNDMVALGAAVTYGGVLKIVPSGTFSIGQQFTLFSGAGAVNPGNFAKIVGTPGSGMAFAFTNGVLSVVAGNAAPVITSITPNVGRTNGGTFVTITGSGFQSGLTVQFGATSAVLVNYIDSTSITAVTPASAPGPVTVTVQNPDSQIATTGFTYVLPPPPATLTSAAKSGNNLVLTWTGGTNQSCVLLSATNLTQARSTWTPVTTNVVLSDGRSTNTIPVNAAEPKRFYLLSVPYN